MERYPKYLILLVLLAIVSYSCNTTSSKQEEENLSLISARNSWIRIGPGGGGSTFIPTFSYADSNTFMIRCDMTGAYLTRDGGSSYNLICYPNGSYSFAFDPLNSKAIYIGSNALNRSLDGGETWERIFPAKDDILEEISEGDHASFSIITKEGSLVQQYG